MQDTPECNKDLQSTETYSSSILSPSLSTSKEERKLFGVLWNVQTDNLLVHLNTIASEAKEFKPTKRTVVGLKAGSQYTHERA